MHVYAQKRIMEQERNDGDDLHDGFDFAVFVRCNDDASSMAIARKPVTASSRPMMTTVTHAGTHPSSTNMIRMEQISNLSAKGGPETSEARNHIPLTAICPSRKSVSDAMPKSTAARKHVIFPGKYNRRMIGTTKKIRASVS